MDNIQSGRTINGKEPSALMDELLNLIKLEDYSLTDNGQPFINADVLQRKLRAVCGFNLRQEPVVLDGGKYVEFVEAAGRLIVNTALRLILCDDNGEVVTTVAKIGSATVAMKKDGSGPVALENDIKSAESDSFKRGVFTFCPKPEGYDAKFKDKKASSGHVEGHAAGNSTELTISKSFYLMRNGMLNGEVVYNGQPVAAVVFSSEATSFAAANNVTAEGAAALLKAGTSIRVICKEGEYQGKSRVVLSNISLISNENTTSNKSDVLSASMLNNDIFDGIISITSSCTMCDDGVSIGVEYGDGVRALMRIKNAELSKIAAMCSIPTEQVIKVLGAGQQYHVIATIASNKDLCLREMCTAKKKGVV